MPPRPPVQHLAKVAPRLRSAISDFGQDYWEPAVGAFYYACFHVALALLSTEGVSPATHRAANESAKRALEFLDATLPVLAQRAPETAAAMPDLAPLRALVAGAEGYTAST